MHRLVAGAVAVLLGVQPAHAGAHTIADPPPADQASEQTGPVLAPAQQALPPPPVPVSEKGRASDGPADAPESDPPPATVSESTETAEPAPALDFEELPVPDDEVALTDPLAPVRAALDVLEDHGFEITGPSEVSNPLQGTGLEAELEGSQQALLQYVLGQVATDGYIILLEPTGAHRLTMTARPAQSGQMRGVFFVNVDKITVDGQFLRDEDGPKLRRALGIRTGVVPASLADGLRNFGYEAELFPVGDGELIVQVAPGRSVRRVRIRGHVPLRKRDVSRSLSPSARPGALARGRCAEPRAVRSDENRPPICAEDDLACRAWERDEVARVERFLFDNGFLRGKASLALACGRARDEADLYVFLDKGKPYKVTRKRITVKGNVTTQDQRWVNWLMRPKVSPFLPIPTRISRKHIEDAKDKVAREYAEPKRGLVQAGAGRRRELELPYPGVRVETSFDTLTPEAVPDDPKLKLDVNVQLGNGVQVAFLGNERIGDSRLLRHIQLFKRREPANSVAVRREAANLRTFYQGRGFTLASVDSKFGEGFGSLELQQLTFVITEGPRTRLRRLDLSQADAVPKVVRTKIKRAFSRQRRLTKGGRFTDADALADLRTILAEYNSRGYLCARARVRLSFLDGGLDVPGQSAVLELTSGAELAGNPDWIREQMSATGLAALEAETRSNAYARIEIDPGPRVLTSGRERVQYLEEPIPGSREITGIPHRAEGDWGKPRMLRDGPLRRSGDERSGGIPLTLTLERETERDVIARYRRSGYPVADVELRWVHKAAGGVETAVTQADRLADLGMCREHQADKIATVDTQLFVYEGKKGKFGQTLLRGNFKTRKFVIKREIDWDEGDDYDESRVTRTRRGIDGTGVTETTQITPYPISCDTGAQGECEVNHVVNMTEAKDISMNLGFSLGATTLDWPFVAITPSFPNLFGTGWDFTLGGHWGFNLSPLINADLDAFCEGQDCYERSARASLGRKRIFASPLGLELTGQIQRRVTPARGQIDSALGTARLTWPINDDWRVYFGYLVQVANVSKDVVKPLVGNDTNCVNQGRDDCFVINRGEAIVPDRTGALETGAAWETVDSAINPHDGFMAHVDLMLASPWFAAWDWWLRFELAWLHFIPLPRTAERLSFRYSIRYGHSIPLPGPGTETRSIPEVWRYFGGGTVDLGLRGIQPQTMLVDIEKIENQFGVTTLRPNAQGGHIRLLATLALRVVSVRKFLGGMLAHSLFFDLGTLTQRWRHVKFARDFRRSVGINFLMWDIPSILTISLGYAVLIPDEIIPGGNVRPTDDPNGRFVFDVGITF